MIDLVVRNGKLVIPGVDIMKADVSVENGKISQIGANLGTAREEVDATGKFVIPGIFDPHTHMGIFGDLAAEFDTETKSALIGGVTTVGCFMGGPDSYLGSFRNVIELAESKVWTDIVFHLGIMTPVQQQEMEDYVRTFGITSFKMYMSGIPGLIPDVDDGFLYETFKKVAAMGGVICVHAENAAIVNSATTVLQAAKPDGTLADWSDSHPNSAEEEAAIRASYFAKLAGCRLYLVHISTREAVEALAGIKQGYDKVYVETTSPYLSINKHNDKGLVAKMVPPFREEESVEALWKGVQSGVVDTIGTDNVTQTMAVKGAEKGMWGAMPGYPALGTHLPVALHYGVNEQGLDLLKVVDAMTRRPAQIFGLYPRKGTIAPGSDADLVLVDMDLEKTVDHSWLGSTSDFSLYDGVTLKGWPVMTIKGGRVIVRDGQVIEDKRGRYLSRNQE